MWNFVPAAGDVGDVGGGSVKKESDDDERCWRVWT
jgi:hypothetical protein